MLFKKKEVKGSNDKYFMVHNKERGASIEDMRLWLCWKPGKVTTMLENKEGVFIPYLTWFGNSNDIFLQIITSGRPAAAALFDLASTNQENSFLAGVICTMEELSGCALLAGFEDENRNGMFYESNLPYTKMFIPPNKHVASDRSNAGHVSQEGETRIKHKPKGRPKHTPKANKDSVGIVETAGKNEPMTAEQLAEIFSKVPTEISKIKENVAISRKEQIVANEVVDVVSQVLL